MTNFLTRPSLPNVTLLVALLLMGLPSYASSGQHTRAPTDTELRQECAPLPEPLLRASEKEGPISTSPNLNARSRGAEIEVFGGGSSSVGDVPAGCVVGGAASSSHDAPRCRLLARILEIREDLKHRRLDRRHERRARRDHSPLLERLRRRH